MSGRVEKRSLKNTISKLRSACDDVFDRFGSSDVMPCTRCFRAKRPCRMADGAKTCQGCKNLKRSCDGLVVASSLQRLSDQRQEWEEKEEQASDALLDLHEKLARIQSEVAEAAGRLARIRAIRKKVKERHVETFARGMQELEEEDGVLPALDAHERWVVSDLQAAGVSNDADWPSFGIGDEFASLGPLVSSSGNPREAVESSGGS
ncbi:hypothetical protein HER10_EVM0005325 [Colletotrichum scovillei]|uniref:uncharacterized protein n=1 Tax=Colletotrichum scovillei TaxID=1209932 RepID=UPI0015C372E9|nr:uncharacterized protein HER10_EVM0002457 [Colletotrichum scovillei]XP_035326550.1 uncharacterized protein HER10_EVM0001658 [Colletotrichum scovillei]XP_035331468.1 uncharacterized protein HER10_EVM0005325 [Colletotrichum scovillei]KAF4772774.1 hypothetical protein HER10_EVM0002457 [Colletotrichum scovillei]KAF4773547.1 hypothetical protein HER10_EVM0001658 [Colletotrichum scovillei]KAF4778465.1 hypothetical protein HER10_EVM0005325 [Colletotrichum scovillei]